MSNDAKLSNDVMSSNEIMPFHSDMPSKDDMSSLDGRKICKSIHQYSKGKITSENMDVLMEIGHGCMVTKNYIYQRYGGIKSLGKL